MRFNCAFLLIKCFLFTFCFADSDSEQKEKFLNGFLGYLNNIPNRQYNYEGFLINAQKINDDNNCYHIEANLKAVDVSDLDVFKYVKCSATIQDLGESVNVQNNEYICIDNDDTQQTDKNLEEFVDDQTTSAPIAIVHEPVHLDNEVQPDSGVTSGEQFIAVPRRQAGGGCVGCSSHVNPQAPGVSDLAALAIRHLDRHEPAVKHYLETVLDVERQVQVVNGVRYILTLQIKSNNCSSEENACIESKTCKISILEKSWIKLPDGSKYRAILSNNCTEEWQFGDEGEFIPNNNVNSENNDVNLPSEDNDHVNVLPKPTPDYDKIANTGSADEILKAIHNIDVQAVPQQEKILTEEDIKYIEQQIIPHNNHHQAVSESQPPLEDVYPSSIKVHQISDSEAVRHDNDRPLQYKPVEHEGKTSYISEDKRKAIDDLINFFNSAGFDSTHTFRRARRSYENDIKVMSLAEKVHKIKKNIQNAQDLYILAQKLVDYMNKNEIGVTNKVLQDVIAAEEEFESLQHFIYIQVRVVIPCDNGICQDKSVLTKICNGIIEDTDEEKPHILSAFCYDEKKKNNQLGKAEYIPTDDPVLLKLSKEALKKIETESSNANAMKIDQILEAYTRKASGRLTNISLRLVYVNCTKEVPYMKRINCTVLHNMDANICEVSVHERHWLKEKTITYKCTPHPVGDRFVKSEQLHDLELSVNDSKVLEMIDEALLHLEFNSNRNNRQKLNKINSVRTQLVSGLLTQIDFDVVYTKCSFDDSSDLSMCEVLENEPARNCKADIWDRPWLEDGRQIKVSCNIRKKRSSNYFVGGATTKDPKDPKYLLLSTESLRSYRETNYISEEYEVVGVESASEQVVAGILTKIAFKIRPKNGQGGEILCHSTIWSRPWLHSTNYNVTCDDNIKSINKRDIAGGEHVRDPNDPKFKEYASKSMQKYLESAGIKKYHKLIEIQSASEQVVSGKLIKLKFRISPTDCELGGSLSNCDIIDASNVLLCHSEIHEQVWLQKQDIDVTCEKEDKNLRVKRQIPGGPTTKDPKDPEYFALATESLRKFTQTNGIREEYQVLSVESASAQVVAGTLTKLTFKIRPKNGQGAEILCHSSIWSRPWLHSTEHTVTCDDNIKSVKKRDIVGGEHVRDSNDPKFKEYASKSMQKYLESAGIKKYHKLIEIQSASEQVVSGKLTKLKFRISPTDCELGGSLSNCDIIDASNVLLCHSKIHEQVWLQKQDIDVTCEKENKNSRVKRQIPGGFVDHDPNDPKYQLLAQASLKKYLKSKNSVRHHEILKIESASTQVVAGLNTLLRYIITPTTCLLDSNLEPTSTNCLVLDNDNIIYCYAEIWTQPWADKEETTVKCNHNRQKSATFENFQENYNPEETEYTVMEHGDSSSANNMQKHNRQRRSLKGSTQKENPNNKEFKIWAEKSFRKYLKRENLKFSHSITVNRVTSQLVSGKIYKIDYIAVPRSCASKKSSKCDENLKHYCHAEILHRPWREGHKIDVHCDRGIDSEEQDSNERRKRDILVGAPVVKNINDEYKMLAEECLAKYQQLSNTKYVHKIIKVHNVTTQVVAGTLTKLDFSISPTKCLIEDNSVTEDCVLQKPKNTLRCQADVWYRPWLQSKEINVDCKKQYSKNLNNNKITKQQIKVKRQVVQPEDDYIDEDTKYYYADRAVQYINDKADTNNLQKLITIHAFQNSLNMGVNMVKMYIETAYTYCLRHQDESDIPNCEELTGMHHRLCYVRLWPSPDDDLVVDSVAIVCNDEEDFTRVTGLSMKDFLKRSVDELESSPKIKNKLISLGEKFMIPSFDSKMPIKLNFLVSSTNCSKQVDRKQIPYLCFVDTGKLTKSCTSYIWMTHNYKKIKKVVVNCGEPREYRRKRSVSLHSNMTDAMLYEKNVQELVKESLEKLEMSSNHNYKQRVLQINSYNSKITTGKLTVIDFDVGYTNCLKYEWVDEITKCEFMEHLPKRHCTSHITERLWSNNGKKIEVECHDIEAPLEAHIEFDNPEKVSYLANQALKHIEAKYLNPFKQKVVRVLSIERQEIAGLHYRMKLEVGVTDCYALSARDDCKFSQHSQNKMCNANIWLRTWTDLPALYRVSCDHQEGTTDHHRDLQAGYLFADFLATYKPDYVDDHEKMRHRYNIFKENIKKIHELNTHEKGTATYGVTRFSDLTYGEFSRKYLGLKPSLRNDNHIPMTKAAIPQVELPDSFDWRHYNAVTEVKDQGSCGSCWAFSVTGNVEGQWKIKTGDLVSLSEQELVDCDKLDDGCNGGLPDNAYRAIEQLGGLETESDYPYEGENDKCSFNKTLSKVQITGAVNITSNETDMAKWLVKNGPISIGINANAMQFYVGGVSHPWKFLCSPSNLDHGVLIVGYGAKDYPMFHKHMPYWIVKNSWGTSWGEQGYYRVYRGDGTCGVNQMASSSVV